MTKRVVSVILVLMLVCSIPMNIALAADGPWKCVYCDIANRANYCTSCGRAKADAITDMRWSCLKCKTINEENALYCKHCGLKKGEQPVKAGDYVFFGTYPQTESGNDSTPIEWLVLEVDEKENKALLLSKYGLDVQQYNTSHTEVTWETCTLRKWLNGTFMNKAFTRGEQGAICTTNVDNSKSQGFDFSTVFDYLDKPIGSNNTKDKIFLLSYAEANKYLDICFTMHGKETKDIAAPTAYAIKQGAYGKTAGGQTTWSWLLRSPGHTQYDAAIVFIVNSESYLTYLGTYPDSGKLVVRPALWVNLESGIF